MQLSAALPHCRPAGVIACRLLASPVDYHMTYASNPVAYKANANHERGGLAQHRPRETPPSSDLH